MGSYKGFVISDIHVGAMPVEKLYHEIQEVFISQLKKYKHIDFIIIDGDFFDHKLFLNDKESAYAYTIISDIINACSEDTKIRLVYGTESHECNQYSIISKLSEIRDTDIKVIHHVMEENLFPDMKVLYLPEEHIIDKDEYYKEFFNEDGKYDYVFGHGIIREAMKEAATQLENKTGKRKKVPVFSTAELRRICRGQVFFGHYHINCDLNDVYYVGSFSRWKFGEEEAKGFYKLTCNINKGEYEATFIENTEAEIYRTIRYGYENKVFDSIDNLDKSLSVTDKMIDNKILDHVRFEFNIPKDNENPEFFINYINERYKFNEAVKVEITHGYIEEKRKKQKEEIEEENNNYSFIFDKSMSLEDKTSYFINIEYNRDIPSERISTYLYKPLNEILNDNVLVELLDNEY